MEFIWIGFAFICGLLIKLVALPPSIGYLAAGFILLFLGYQADSMVTVLADIGITLMLFTIGLKLNIKDLLKPEVWFGSLSHSIMWLFIGLILLKTFALIAIPFVSGLSITTTALIVFALSFSSTVCVVKLMEEHGEMRTRHGKLAIGILVMQDVVAVIFLVVATGKIPSPWAGLLLLFIPLKPLISKAIDKAGHGELIPLMGFFITFGAYELFELVHVKGDLGALLAGMYLASHSKASEITKSLLSFKDLFLIGFFLSIGFTALPTLEMLAIASILTLLLPIKFMLFFFILVKLKLRGRTAFLSALALSNFSEFGLIIAALSTKAGWLSSEWLVILSLAVALSFIMTNILYNFAHDYFANNKEKFKRYESKKRLVEDDFVQPCDAPIAIIGMGRVGIGAYKALNAQVGNQVWGLDTDKNKVNWLIENNVQAFEGDAEDADFWENMDLSKIELILLALPAMQDIKNITTQIKRTNYQGKIAAIARYDDDRIKLESFGVDKVFNFYNEAGVGFAEESMSLLKNA
ncbi:cation:proton antiporter family protein [Cognaticolwellia beringensis]|uniref:Potassium transporter Kef n=1 Tax=Cognaticolwellia beringensis TaxID=1967665 RepID=A0A222G5C5_9GAMM|nr:cation:proton antiporter family protein [Cognaticolwellia beringensis]ASP47117.1 potassium transporter Kef [Cognaticolwellia beringensis]